MRHIPTSLYIDTEVFKRQGLRLDTNDFNSLKDTFVKGGLRLLIPAMMEREILRHYWRQAEECADAVHKAQQKHPMPFLKMWTPRPKNEVIDECFNELKSQWEQFKSHFVVEELPLVGDIDRVVDWYFSVEPPFSKNKNKEFPDAFILSALESYHNDHKANIAVVSGDGDFGKSCKIRRYIYHFDSLKEYASAFKPEFTREQHLIEEPVDPTQSIVTEDLQELKAILGRGDGATQVEIDRVIKLLQSRGDNYRYFFNNADEPMWIPHLKASGLLDNLPEVEQTEDGSLKIPDWPPIYYLERVCDSAREEVFTILEGLPENTNPRVLEGIVTIVLKSDDTNDLMRLSEKILAFVDHSRWGHEKIIQLVNRLSLMDRRFGGFSESFLLKVVEFQPDQQAEDKQARRRANPEDWTTRLEPRPRFDEWEYCQILEKGVRPLAEREPYSIARILLDATATMIRLFYQDDLEESSSNDLTFFLFRRVNELGGGPPNSKDILVHTLTFACEKVYEKAPEAASALDQALRNQSWGIFIRICQHLYSLHLNEQTKPWIREMILAHEDYDKWDHRFEFQHMIRLACEKFGDSLLTKAEKERIFETILSGPSEQHFRDRAGDRFTEESFEERKRHFHRMQLNPFASVLFGKYSEYFEELNAEEEKPITDDDYGPYRLGDVKQVEERSPKPADELDEMSDEEILSFLNEWENVDRDPDEWWVHINFEGLAQAFQSIFKEVIIPNESRLHFWTENRDQLKRPIYVEAIVSAIQEQVKLKQFDKLDQWFDLCEWVLSHPDQPKEEEVNRSDVSREHPDWQSSRQAVGDFVGMCLKEDVNVPISMSQRLVSLLDKLCTQYDRRLDEDDPVFTNRDDQLTEAINNTRSKALEHLVDFGYWVRRQSGDNQADTPEVFTILDKRLGSECKYALTLPEYALLGLNYGRICDLNREWAVQHKRDLLPQEKIPAWTEAFENFLRYNRPYKQVFDIVRDDIEFALENIDKFKTDSTDTLGEHLFTYYLWEVYPLTGDSSLLEEFYKKTKEDKDRWSHLFNHIGISLKNSDKQLEAGLKQRTIDFFNWRFEKKEPSELKEFTFWLGAECLDAEWRLTALSKILDISGLKDIKIYMQIDVLREMIEDHTTLVVECFAKLTDFAVKNNESLYIPTNEAKPILRAGLKSDDETVQENAKRARENLLRCGCFDLLNLED